MKTAAIEGRLRDLAARLNGVRIGHHVLPSYHGPTRMIGVTVVEDDGTDTDLAEELGRLADEIGMLTLPKVKR